MEPKKKTFELRNDLILYWVQSHATKKKKSVELRDNLIPLQGT